MKKLFIFVVIIALVAGAIAYAPAFLVRSDNPDRSDVIVLFLGVEYTTRKKEAFKLIEEGYARHLIIPAHGKISEANLFSNQPGQIQTAQPTSIRRNRIIGTGNYPKYYEDTHIEILEAKRMMDRSSFKTAIFVSSPYHMRRISLISRDVFKKGEYRVTYIPSRFEHQSGVLWFLNKDDRKQITREYLKIAWFLLYRFLPVDMQL